MGGSRATRARIALASLCGLAWIVACEPEGAGVEGIPVPENLSASRGVLILEPPRLEIGDVASLELVVVTPPHCRVLPAELPPTPGLWVLERREDPVERAGGRWIHRTRLRVRPRELGRHEWPALVVLVEDDGGRRSPVAIEGRSFEVVSILPQLPARAGPFGPQSPEPPETRTWSSLLAAALGAGALALGFGIRRALRWRGARKDKSVPASLDTGTSTPWEWARDGLEAAQALARQDPRSAATAGARLMRGYVDRRYGTDIRGATTDELATGTPRWFLRSRWPQLLEIFRALDHERFRPDAASPQERSRRVCAVLESAQRFVAESAQQGGSH